MVATAAVGAETGKWGRTARFGSAAASASSYASCALRTMKRRTKGQVSRGLTEAAWRGVENAKGMEIVLRAPQSLRSFWVA